jgi:hypothetical protein
MNRKVLDCGRRNKQVQHKVLGVLFVSKEDDSYYRNHCDDSEMMTTALKIWAGLLNFYVSKNNNNKKTVGKKPLITCSLIQPCDTNF